MQPSTHARLAEIRRDNLLRVLDGALAVPGQFGVEEVSAHSGLSVATVRQGLQQIADAGVLATEWVRPASGIGRPALRFAAVEDLPTVLVVRVGMAHAEIVAATLAGEQLHTQRRALSGDGPLAGRLVGQIEEFLEECPITPECFVLTVTGIVDQGRVMKSVRHPALEHEATIDAIRRAGLRGSDDAEFVLANDSKVAASRAFEQAAATDVAQQAVVCHVDDSISCGLVVDGKVLQGAHGAAGEVDNTGQGPWSRADQALGDATFRRGISGSEFFGSAREGDPDAVASTQSILANLAEAIAPLVLAFDPGVLLISGEVLRVEEMADAILRERVLGKTPLPPELRFVPATIVDGALALAVRTTRDRVVRTIVDGHA